MQAASLKTKYRESHVSQSHLPSNRSLLASSIKYLKYTTWNIRVLGCVIAMTQFKCILPLIKTTDASLDNIQRR